MPTNDSNTGLSLEALLAAARGAEQEAGAPAAEAAPSSQEPQAASPAAEPARKEAAEPSTEAAEPAAEPSAAVQEEALEEAEAEPSAPAFDLAAALGYGSGSGASARPAAAAEPAEEKFDLAAALGYKSAEVREREAAEAAEAHADAQAQEVLQTAMRNAEREARMREREAQQQARMREREAAKAEKAAAEAAKAEARGVKPEEPSLRAAHEPVQREPKTEAGQRMEERRAERKRTARATTGLGAQSTADAAAAEKKIESYQPSQRDRSATARAARPLKQEEVTEVAEAIAAENARIEYAQAEKEKVVEVAPAEQPKEEAAKPAEEKFVEAKEQPAAPLGEPIILPEPEPEPEPEPTPASESAQPEPAAQQPAQSKPVDFMSPEFANSIAAGAPAAPAPIPAPAPAPKPPTPPHKVAVRTTEEIIKPVNAPPRLGVISPEAARHEAEAKKKVQKNERKIVKRVRRYRALGMLLIVVALAALAGAVFLFLAGNAQASESIENTAVEICEDAGRTITYRYKAADSNGTLCPTTEVATFSAGDVLEQSVITMNTPDFETAAHTLANFKKQFEATSYVDGRVDGSTVIFTLHMSNERIMKVTYTALLMKNTTGCEVIL